MASDDAVLEAVAAGAVPPTLRLYAWDPPCLSIGYAQRCEDVDSDALQKLGWDVVRRPTGGKALLHVDEITYAVALPEDHPLAAGGVLASYRHLSEALLAGLRLLGIRAETRIPEPAIESEARDPVCFQVPSAHEIIAAGRKLVGSAQLRRRRCVLQHGALPLRGDIGRVCLGLRYPDEQHRQEAASRLRHSATTAEEQLGSAPGWEEAARAIVEGFRDALGITFEERPLTEGERRRSLQLRSQRYARNEWTRRI